MQHQTQSVDVADVVQHSRTRLLRLAYQLTHDPSTAQDLVQDALLRFVDRHGSQSPDVGNTMAYLRRIMLNEYLGRRRRPHLDEVLTATPPEEPVWDLDAAVTADQRDRLWTALAELPPRQRAALVLRYYEQLADAEIAAVLQGREATVRSLCRRGLIALRTDPAFAAEAQED